MRPGCASSLSWAAPLASWCFFDRETCVAAARCTLTGVQGTRDRPGHRHCKGSYLGESVTSSTTHMRVHLLSNLLLYSAQHGGNLGWGTYVL
jgi:hypothetical protein